ncbi:MAG: zinc ribbon domain-containing protein [Candidatus Bathyarchaeota archaeon]
MVDLFNVQYLFVSWFFVASAFFLIGLLLCIWVYRDAQQRGMNGALWLIIVLIANIVGLLIYLVVRDPVKPYPPPATYSTNQYCKYCGSPLSPDARFCPKCGKEQT